jgi:hypothetical protein
MLGVMNFLPSPALHLFERCAGVVVPALVVPVDPTGLVGSPGELTDIIGQLAEARLAVAQRHFSPTLLDGNGRRAARRLEAGNSRLSRCPLASARDPRIP